MMRGRVVLLLAAALVMLQLASMAARQGFYGPGPLASARDIVIPAGGGATAAAALRKAGAVSYPWVFRVAAWTTRADGPVHAGEFLLPAHASISDILEILRHGAPVQHQVTIPEGLTGVQIARILNAAVAATGRVPPPPDGAVLPQTYDYIFGTPRAAILARAEAAMRAALRSAWAGRDAVVPLASERDALVLASIVQEESPVPAELPKIAAVYENRMVLGMKLQADPTVIYAASAGEVSGGLPISRAALANPSAYNTYIYAGLPPGPICAPGVAAIAAVLHPAPIADLYFVATGHGGHVFAQDFAGQLRNIARYHGRRPPNDKVTPPHG
jgi:UPF0755 protein